MDSGTQIDIIEHQWSRIGVRQVTFSKSAHVVVPLLIIDYTNKRYTVLTHHLSHPETVDQAHPVKCSNILVK